MKIIFLLLFSLAADGALATILMRSKDTEVVPESQKLQISLPDVDSGARFKISSTVLGNKIEIEPRPPAAAFRRKQLARPAAPKFDYLARSGNRVSSLAQRGATGRSYARKAAVLRPRLGARPVAPAFFGSRKMQDDGQAVQYDENGNPIEQSADAQDPGTADAPQGDQSFAAGAGFDPDSATVVEGAGDPSLDASAQGDASGDQGQSGQPADGSDNGADEQSQYNADGQSDGQPDDSADGQAGNSGDGQADYSGDGQSDGQTDYSGDGQSDDAGDGQSDGQADYSGDGQTDDSGDGQSGEQDDYSGESDGQDDYSGESDGQDDYSADSSSSPGESGGDQAGSGDSYYPTIPEYVVDISSVNRDKGGAEASSFEGIPTLLAVLEGIREIYRQIFLQIPDSRDAALADTSDPQANVDWYQKVRSFAVNTLNQRDAIDEDIGFVKAQLNAIEQSRQGMLAYFGLAAAYAAARDGPGGDGAAFAQLDAELGDVLDEAADAVADAAAAVEELSPQTDVIMTEVDYVRENLDRDAELSSSAKGEQILLILPKLIDLKFKVDDALATAMAKLRDLQTRQAKADGVLGSMGLAAQQAQPAPAQNATSPAPNVLGLARLALSAALLALLL